jgi:hypothetical protein
MAKEVVELKIDDTVKVQNLKESLENVLCFNENVNELLRQFLDDFTTETGELKDINLNTAVGMLQALWDKIKETSLECQGKEIKVELTGDGLPIFLLKALLAGVGFRL